MIENLNSSISKAAAAERWRHKTKQVESRSTEGKKASIERDSYSAFWEEFGKNETRSGFEKLISARLD